MPLCLFIIANGDLVDGGIADENGIFKLNMSPNEYSLNFEYVGFESVKIKLKRYNNNINIGTIKLASFHRLSH